MAILFCRCLGTISWATNSDTLSALKVRFCVDRILDPSLLEGAIACMGDRLFTGTLEQSQFVQHSNGSKKPQFQTVHC